MDEVIKKPRGRPRKDGNTVTPRALKKACGEVTSFQCMPSQMDFLQATEKEVAFSGGWASGKSSALLIALVQSVAGKPGAISLLVRRHAVTLARTTLPMLISRTGDMKPILPDGTYDYLKGDAKIVLRGGGTILLRGADDPMRIRSLNVGWIGVDEACELEENQYIELLGRLRLSTGSLQIKCATNPSHINHWLYRRFCESNPDRKIIYGNSLDNPYLPDSYRAWLSALTGDRRERMVHGRWTAQGDAVYPDWNPSSMVVSQPADLEGEWMIGIDYGQTHPTAMQAACVGEDGILRIVEEFHCVSPTFRQILAWLEKWRDKSPTICYDPSAKSIATELEAAGWQGVVRADNDVAIGIERVRDRLISGSLHVDPSCAHLISEMTTYSWDASKPGKPVKEVDDQADCLRYLCGLATVTSGNSLGPVYAFG